MSVRNRPDRNEKHRYSQKEDAGYQDRFGAYGMRGRERHMENEVSAYDERAARPAQGYNDYASFEGATDRPYYGGEEGRFPYGGAQDNYPQSRNSWNADERNYSGQWMGRGEHYGKGPKGYRRADGRTQEEVCDMLTQHGEVDASEIEVDVKDGVVTLTGTVESRKMKRMVEDLVDRINGVNDVRNDLRVMAQGIAPMVGAGEKMDARVDIGSDRSNSSVNSPASHNVTTKDRSSKKNLRPSQSSQRRMNQ